MLLSRSGCVSGRGVHSQPSWKAPLKGPLAHRCSVVRSHQCDDEAICSSRASPSQPLPDLSRLAQAVGAVMVCTTALAICCQPARAEEREWKPRRHYRKMGERYTDKWAYELAEEQEKEASQQLTAKRRAQQLQREREEAEAAQRRKAESESRKKAEAILAQQAKEAQAAKELPFSVKVGGTEMAPYIIWGGVGILALGALKGLVSGAQSMSRGKEGKWVYDRSLGGKKVWVPADGTTEGRSELNERDFDELTSIAAAAAAAEKQKEKSPVYQLPTWWNPSVRAPASEALRTSRQADAARLLARMENNRNMGEDFALRDIVKLREMCQEGGVTVKPRTVGARDALYRTAVDAAVAVATDPSESFMYIGDASPTRFLSALAIDIEMPPEKAVHSVTTAVAAATRARLLEALAGIKEDHTVFQDENAPSSGDRMKAGETVAVMSLIRLTSLLEKLPVLSGDSKEVKLIAESLQGTFSVEERRRAFYLMGQLFPEAAALAAALLGFDPDAVVPQLLSDMEEYRRQYEAASKMAAASTAQEGATEATSTTTTSSQQSS